MKRDKELLREFSFRVAAEIARARKAAGLTQAQVAARLQITQTEVSRFERGSPQGCDLYTFTRVAKAMRVHPATLLRRVMRYEVGES